ncbi:MAG: hypothetical protein AAYR33_07305 [Acetobacteraceae bacterium]
MTALRDWFPIERFIMWLPESTKGRAVMLLLFFPIFSLIPIILTYSLGVMMIVVLGNFLIIPALLWWAVKTTSRRPLSHL